MLSPFLTHNATLADGSAQNLWTATSGKVVDTPVVAIKPRPGGGPGVEITTRGADGAEQVIEFVAALLTASPSAIRSRIHIDKRLISHDAAYCLRELRLINSGKIAISFPDLGANNKYSQAWWMMTGETGELNPDCYLVVSKLTGLSISSAYTFDNYHWVTGSTGNPGDMVKSGVLMIGYTWDYNSDALSPPSAEQQVRVAWDQFEQICAGTSALPGDIDEYRDWAITNRHYQAVVWSTVDGFVGRYRMSSPGLNQRVRGADLAGGQTELWAACESSCNPDTGLYTGLFPAGEAVAWLGLSGWMEGAIQTALASTIGIVKYLNK